MEDFEKDSVFFKEVVVVVGKCVCLILFVDEFWRELFDFVWKLVGFDVMFGEIFMGIGK